MRGDLFAHITQNTDKTFSGVWSVFMLQSAFQPIFGFEQGRLDIKAFEGLIRPARGGVSVSPGEFFGKVPSDQRMHVETLSRTLHLLNAGQFLDPSADVFINFDPSVFIDRELTRMVLRDLKLVLHEAHIDPRRIVCELTESPARSEVMLFEFVAELREHGFRIAVDDYGADNSDIRRIDELRPDIIKFDAGWTVQLMRTGSGFALLETMVSRFRDMGLKTVFEGIEEHGQLEQAERAGVDMVQGFVLARPQLAPTSFAVDWREHQPLAAKASPQRRSIASSAEPTHSQRVFGRRSV